jgi:hypothetical protein
MNTGWVGFALVEFLDARDLIRLFTPIMGLSILIAIVAFALRLRATTAPTAAPMATAGGGD